ncbi:hypothetical protein K461DRAFT_274057 [Myriangium duriaei CBS 260.36]|uniref:Nuclear segregation protein Bfr1 n=1 Tax=Myriangium duriaei CBS 260.36 TaxID=1168546 RepID=A0A9P4MM07_9PEZI|nr:hypothetical protein K461DRAFT_274057 [Myriangium duriaei CBS 260.36]
MADLATPSAATMSTMDAKADVAATSKTAVSKPDRPDEDSFKKSLAQAEKELAAVQEKQKANKSKLEIAQPNKDSPVAKRRQELIEERNKIKSLQQSGKSSRGQTMDKIKRLDEQLKSHITEQKTAKGRVPFKSADEVQQQIDRLQKQVDTGMMKLVDEKKALTEITNLNKQKKSFGGIDDIQKRIDKVKAQIAEEKKALDDPESRALSDRYTEISAELDKIKSDQDDVYKNLNSLRDERTKLHEEQQGKYQAVKDIKDKYYQAKRAFAEYEKEAYRIRREKQKAERDAYEQGKRKQVAQQKLEDASAPAYQDEILTAQGLIRYFDPSSAEAKAAVGPGKFAAAASRTVDDSGFKGTRLAKKGDDEEDYFVGGGGKKKKGKKGRDSPAPATEKFNLSIGVIEELAKVGVEPPMNSGDVPAVVEKLKEKLQNWKSDQDRKTKENITKAENEIKKLEAEAQAEANGATEGRSTEGAARKPAQKLQGVNGQSDAGAEQRQEKDAVADATEDLSKAKLEDGQ